MYYLNNFRMIIVNIVNSPLKIALSSKRIFDSIFIPDADSDVRIPTSPFKSPAQSTP